ncbi:MAG: glycosyltransferase [Muribaculaceae bacterium]|nr:glycosyltransferase [Muribaculaceae bacterium]
MMKIDDKDSEEISIIVPVYNVAAYLRECLNSIEKQTFRNWECILVDDGSLDDSGAICDEYASRDPRFRVIHQKNGGLSAARNSGLRVCKGKFVAFIDSDDYVSADFLDRMREVITASEADVVQCCMMEGYTTFSKNRSLVKDTTTLNRKQVAEELMKNKIIPSYMWIKLFRRSVIDTPFPEGMVFEDIYTLSNWAKNINKMVLIPDMLYYYRQRKSSIANTNSVDNIMDRIKAFMYRTTKLREIEPEAISGYLSDKTRWIGIIAAARNLARYMEDPKKRHEGISQISSLTQSCPEPSLKALGLKKWWRAYLLRNHPDLFITNIRLLYAFYFRKHRNVQHLFD